MDQEKLKNDNVYLFDDLFVNCCQEIMQKSMDTDDVPETIKDWIGGKVLRAFPRGLTRRLLGMLLENRDLGQVMGFRECGIGQQAKEFTLILYSSAQHKMDKSELLEDPESGISQSALDMELGTVPNMFVDEKGMTRRGLDFFAEELCVDRNQTIPTRLNREMGHMEMDTAESSCNEFDSQDDGGFSDDSAELQSKYPIMYHAGIPMKQKPRQYRRTYAKDYLTKGMRSECRTECHICQAQFSTAYALYKHHAANHPDHWAAREKPSKGFRVDKCFAPDHALCHLCDFKTHFIVKLRSHQEEDHPEWWAKRESMNPLKSERGKKHRASIKDMIECGEVSVERDPDTGKALSHMCKTCGYKVGGSVLHEHTMRRHVDAMHRKTIQAKCKICKREFVQARSLKRHMIIHTGVYAFPCEHCPKKYRDRAEYNQHLKAKHPEYYRKDWQAAEREKDGPRQSIPRHVKMEGEETLLNGAGLDLVDRLKRSEFRLPTFSKFNTFNT